MAIDRLETATTFQAQRLDQLLRLNKHFETAHNLRDREVTIENGEGKFSFRLDNTQRFTFFRMLRGRLNSMKKEGLGNIGWQLIGGEIRVPTPIRTPYDIAAGAPNHLPDYTA